MKLKWSLPEIIVFAVAALLPTYLIRFHVGPVPMTVLEIVELAAIVALIAKFQVSSFRFQLGRNRLLAIGSALLIIATVIGIIVAPDTRAALGIAKAYFWEPMLLAWLLVAARPDKEKMFRAFALGAAVSTAVVIGYAFIQFSHPSRIPAPWDAERRITSVFPYPNATALYLAPIAPLLLSLPWGWVLGLLALMTTVLARSVGGLLAGGAALVAAGAADEKKRTRTIFLAVAALSVGLLALRTPVIQKQIAQKQWSARVRDIGYHETFAMLRDHPLFGAGISGFPIVVKPYHRATAIEIFQYPHNLFLTIWSELGLIGLAGFVCIIVWFFKKRDNWMLNAAMLAILLHGLIDVPYFKNDLAMFFWLLIVMVAL
jgi:O-antigen ligase